MCCITQALVCANAFGQDMVQLYRQMEESEEEAVAPRSRYVRPGPPVAWPPTQLEALKKVVIGAAMHIKGVQPPHVSFAGSFGRIPQGPIPVKELSDPEVIPFLIDVLLHGPAWEVVTRRDEWLLEGVLPQVARYAAAINLGAHKDPRGYEPLAAMLQQGGVIGEGLSAAQKEEYDIRVAAALGLGYLGDQRAVPLLLAALQDQNWHVRLAAADALGFLEAREAVKPLMGICSDPSQDNELRAYCLMSLARIRDMSALPVVVRVGKEIGIEPSCYRLMVATNLDIEYKSKIGRTESRYFPELGPVRSEVYVWEHWLKVGRGWTAARFEEWYEQGRAQMIAHSQAPEMALSRLDVLGFAALPHYIEKLKQGETIVIPMIRRLTQRELPEDVTQAQVLQWWEREKDRWLIPWQDGLPAAAEPVRTGRPVWTGILLTGGNPYFLLWWATVGLGLSTQAMALGAMAFVLFAVVHWVCDLAWLTALSLASRKGITLMGPRAQRVVTMICAAAMAVFGGWFLYDAVRTVWG
jgi:hypothetical protein